ncbi:MAG: glycerophosphodiester phosphodiesterase [Chloroflexi bacterium]|nr:MAG: glycerophosphodiester phosphodiesterase [Chloroflexota bacterium]
MRLSPPVAMMAPAPTKKNMNVPAASARSTRTWPVMRRLFCTHGRLPPRRGEQGAYPHDPSGDRRNAGQECQRGVGRDHRRSFERLRELATPAPARSLEARGDQARRVGVDLHMGFSSLRQGRRGLSRPLWLARSCRDAPALRRSRVRPQARLCRRPDRCGEADLEEGRLRPPRRRIRHRDRRSRGVARRKARGGEARGGSSLALKAANSVLDRSQEFKIVAHRGVTARAPGNTMAAFRAALELGADAIELDVRLSSDGVPMVHHNWYVDENATRPICGLTALQLRSEKVTDSRADVSGRHPIPTLEDVLREFGRKISLEIEMKGPEPEAPPRVASVLNDLAVPWSSVEVTSFHPTLLITIRDLCPDVATAYLFPLSEQWMRLDVVAYAALHGARQAKADAVHLSPNQLSEEVVASIRAAGVEVHAHAVNDQAALELAAGLGVPWICTDAPEQALKFRRQRA